MKTYRIVGQGLAGSILAWQLMLRDQRIVVTDRGEASTSSRVAAGLITPITGGRLSASWRWREFWPTARGFYRNIESETKSRFFYEIPIDRQFYHEEEESRFAKKRDKLAKETGLVLKDFDGPPAGFTMPGAWLDVPAFLDATKARLESQGIFEIGEVDPDNLSSNETTLFCEGWAGRNNPWFPDLTFRAAKGQILELESEEIPRDRVLNRRTWVLPTHGNKLRVGATYEWDFTEDGPTENGREELVGRLDTMIKEDYKIVGQSAGIRPIIRQSRPLVGLHPEEKNVGLFNGLGSKGVLNAPWCARQFADSLASGAEIDPAIALGW